VPSETIDGVIIPNNFPHQYVYRCSLVFLSVSERVLEKEGRCARAKGFNIEAYAVFYHVRCLCRSHGEMGRNHRVLKTLIFATVVSYFTYAFYWFVKTIPWIVEISLRPEYYSPPAGLRFTSFYSVSVAYLAEYSNFFGLMIRAIGASYALLTAFLILKTKTNCFSLIRDKVSKVLLIEGLYFLSLVPTIYFLLGFSALPSVSYFLLSTVLLSQILLISPFLINLGLKVRKYEPGVGRSSILRLAGLSYVNYVIALWGSYILKWTEMSFADPYLFSAFSARIFGFLNTAVVQSLAVVFAVAGLLYFLRKSGSDNTMRWWGLSLIFLSLHLILYVIYLVIVGAPRFIPFGELWIISLLGLGIYLLLKNPKTKFIR
jgi:hypothetical protein